MKLHIYLNKVKPGVIGGGGGDDSCGGIFLSCVIGVIIIPIPLSHSIDGHQTHTPHT